jgi:hypothetical protein
MFSLASEDLEKENLKKIPPDYMEKKKCAFLRLIPSNGNGHLGLFF